LRPSSTSPMPRWRCNCFKGRPNKETDPG